MLAAADLLADDVCRLEQGHQRVEDLPRLRAFIRHGVGDINVQRETLFFRPGVDRDVKAGELNESAEAGRVELAEPGVEHREAGHRAELQAALAHGCRVRQQRRVAAATAQVAKEMWERRSSSYPLKMILCECSAHLISRP